MHIPNPHPKVSQGSREGVYHRQVVEGDNPVLGDSPTIITETGNHPRNGLKRASSTHFDKNIIPSGLGELAEMVASGFLGLREQK